MRLILMFCDAVAAAELQSPFEREDGLDARLGRRWQPCTCCKGCVRHWLPGHKTIRECISNALAQAMSQISCVAFSRPDDGTEMSALWGWRKVVTMGVS